MEDAEILAAITRINAQIGALAPVLNSAETVEVAVAAAVEEVPIDALARRYGADLYLFAVPMRLGATEGAFEIAGLVGHLEAEVLGEDRVVEVVDGRLVDAFEIYQVHRYQIADAFH